MIEGTLSFLSALVGSLLVGWLIAVPEEPFDRHLRGRVLRMMGRTVLVLGIIGVGVGSLNGSPAGVLIGAIAGWLLPTVAEARRLHRPVGRLGNRPAETSHAGVARR